LGDPERAGRIKQQRDRSAYDLLRKLGIHHDFAAQDDIVVGPQIVVDRQRVLGEIPLPPAEIEQWQVIPPTPVRTARRRDDGSFRDRLVIE
jgi:hypothetical protein